LGEARQPRDVDPCPGTWDLSVGECQRDVREASGQDVGADPLGDLFRRAGEAEAVGELIGRAAQGFCGAARRIRVVGDGGRE
jgi:hypothetical protein